MDHDHEHEPTNRSRDRGAAIGRSENGTSPGLRWASILGNRAIRRLVGDEGRARPGGTGAGPLDEAVSREIESRRGRGTSLDGGARADLEPRMGQDFSDVRVHTGPDADRLSRAVQAEAFTTGSDVFFRHGNYRPASSEGRKLLAHELTHVVQQRAVPSSSSGSLVVTEPDDSTEVEADAVARAVTSSPVSEGHQPNPNAKPNPEPEPEQLRT